MRFLTRQDAWALIAEEFSADLLGDPAPAEGTARVDGGLPRNTAQLGYYIEDSIYWLRPNTDRLLWLTSAGGPPVPFFGAFRAMSVGVGATTELVAKPICYFDPQSWISDPGATTTADLGEMEVLVGMLILIVVGQWDAWLLSSKTTDAVEFWEGNVLFHSSEKQRMTEARKMQRRYKVSRMT